jgi:hypothetical protein
VLQSTVLKDPLPPAAGDAAICAMVLPVLARHHSERLAELGLLSEAVAAAVRLVRAREYALKVAAVRTCGRMLQWAVHAPCVDDVFALVEVAKTALAPDQDRSLHVVRPPPRMHACCIARGAPLRACMHAARLAPWPIPAPCRR